MISNKSQKVIRKQGFFSFFRGRRSGLFPLPQGLFHIRSSAQVAKRLLQSSKRIRLQSNTPLTKKAKPILPTKSLGNGQSSFLVATLGTTLKKKRATLLNKTVNQRMVTRGLSHSGYRLKLAFALIKKLESVPVFRRKVISDAGKAAFNLLPDFPWNNPAFKELASSSALARQKNYSTKSLKKSGRNLLNKRSNGKLFHSEKTYPKAPSFRSPPFGGVLLFSRKDLAFINLRSILSSLLKALQVCLFASLNNKRIIFVGDPRPLVQEHQQRLLSCFIGSQVKGLSTKITALLPKTLQIKQPNTLNSKGVQLYRQISGAILKAGQLFKKNGVGALSPGPTAFLVNKTAGITKKSSKPTSWQPLPSVGGTSSTGIKTTSPLFDNKALSLELKQPGAFAETQTDSKQGLLQPKETNPSMQTASGSSLRASAFIKPVLNSALKQGGLHQPPCLGKDPVNTRLTLAGYKESRITRAADWKLDQVKKKGFYRSLIFSEANNSTRIRPIDNLREKLGLIQRQAFLSSEKPTFEPVVSNGAPATIHPQTSRAGEPSKQAQSFNNKNKGENPEKQPLRTKPLFYLQKEDTTPLKDPGAKPDKKDGQYFLYTTMSRLVCKAGIRSSQWTATLAQPTNLWLGGFFSNNIATYRKSLSTTTLLNIEMGAPHLLSNLPFQAIGASSKPLPGSKLTGGNAVTQNPLLPIGEKKPSCWFSSPEVYSKNKLKSLLDQRATFRKAYEGPLWSRSSFSIRKKAGRNLQPHDFKGGFGTALTISGKESSAAGCLEEAKLLPSSPSFIDSIGRVDRGLWNAIYAPVPRKDLFKSLEGGDSSLVKGSPLSRNSPPQLKGNFTFSRKQKLQSFRSFYPRLALKKTTKQQRSSKKVKSKNFHKRVLAYCLKSVEANKVTNAWMKEADLVFFANPEKSLSLLNQINRLKIPTLGIINTKSNLAIPYREAKGPSLSTAKPAITYPIVGSNSLNFLRIVLTKFACVLNRDRIR